MIYAVRRPYWSVHRVWPRSRRGYWNRDRSAMQRAEDVMRRAEEAGQGHLFEEWESLSKERQEELLRDVEGIDFDDLKRIFNSTTAPPVDFKPAQNITQLKDITPEQAHHWKSVGLDLINQGRVAVVILAGGQGTRLGSAKPKGCYDVGLPSKSSLFQIHCERIQRIQHLAQQHGGGRGRIYVYFMTSLQTHDQTVSFFRDASYFGLEPDQVKFFQQGIVPCCTEHGKIILATPSSVAVSPNGNGGIYKALESSGSLVEMQHHGILCIDCFSVDNLLARPADPLFLGHCWESNTPCGARVVAKSCSEEKVGVFVSHQNRAQVVEYSELSPEIAQTRDPHTQQLVFNWGNICMHFFRIEFLQRVARMHLPFHMARKSIPSCGNHIQGIKLEMFIFDVFPLAEAVSLMEVRRDEQYAPIKNASGTTVDSPDTARDALLRLHRRWVEAAGGVVDALEPVEIPPLVSYEGEELESFLQERQR